MNQLAHILINYIVLGFFIPEINNYIWPLIIFSVILDLDHIPNYIKLAFMTKKERKKLKQDDLTNMFRTAVQEPIGIITIELMFLTLYLYGIKNTLLLIASASVALHWIVDFLTVHTRPFFPFNNKIVSLFFHTRKQRMVSEVVITVVILVLFLII